MDEELSAILARGQRIAVFPARYTEEFVGLLQRVLPQHEVGLLGEKRLELWVHPRLSGEEQAQWEEAYRKKRRELRLKD